jgi:hypothetical protein
LFIVWLPPVATLPKSIVLLVSQVKWVGRTHPWTTNNDEQICHLLFGFHITESDVASGMVCGSSGRKLGIVDGVQMSVGIF